MEKKKLLHDSRVQFGFIVGVTSIACAQGCYVDIGTNNGDSHGKLG